MAWVRELTGPLIATAAIAAFQAWSPGFSDKLGFVGDFLEWRWTPTLTFAVLALLTLLARPKQASYGQLMNDPRTGTTVESDGIKWVFLGWRDNGYESVPVLDPQCPEHRIPLKHKSIGKGEKLESLAKAGRFSGTRSLYCVGDKPGSGHEIKPFESANWSTAGIRAAARLHGVLPALTEDAPTHQSVPDTSGDRR